ncbi:MAG: 2-dehydropantoate 2-reductase [Desulfobulbaceae bacterium]|nr:2-dehydropantoate 2-reductase [Desulfobulbaceae bacterium]
MKIAVIGPGALGTLLATSLAGVDDNEVWLLDHNPDRAAQINRKLRLDIEEQEFSLNIPVTSQPDRIGIAELVFLCVKSMNVEQALQRAAPLFSRDTLLIPFQNGIGHIEAISGNSIARNTAFGVTSQGATLLAPGHVRHGGAGVTKIGFIDSADDQQKKQLEDTARILTASGFDTVTVANILDHIWAKLLVNIGINALTVIHDCPNGKLLEIPEARETLIAAVREGEKVARALGIHIENDPVDLTLDVCRTTASNISSMLQDARKQKPTEIDAINGALVAKAADLSIDVPVNQLLVEKVKQRQAHYQS